MTDRSVLFGVPIDGYSMTQTLDVIDECIRYGRAHERSYQVTTVNVDFLVNAISDPQVMALLQRADLNLADGMPLIWASRILGTPIPERVAGADLVPLLAAESAARGWRVHLFGAGPGVAQRARDTMLEAHPDAMITADAGPPSLEVGEPDSSLIDSIRCVDADVLCIALGNPKQERFIATYREWLQCPVMIGIGGSLDMLVGEKKRAPSWVQRAGAEWVFRAAQEPVRLGRRYAHDISVFGPHLGSYLRSVRRYRTADHLTSMRDESGQLSVVRAERDRSRCEFDTDLDGITSVDIDLEGISALAPSAHARMVGLIRDTHMGGIPTTTRHVSRSLASCLGDYQTWNLVTEIQTQS